MKKLLAILILCLGFSLGASAQDEKADNYAEQITIALSDLTKLKIDMEDYVKTCEAIGLEMGEYISTLDLEEIDPFLEQFYHCIYYHFAKYGFPRNQADMVIESFKEAFYAAIDKELGNNVEEDGVAVKADQFAKQISNLIEDSFHGEEDNKEAENVGFELGKYLGRLNKDEIKIFQTEFYAALTIYISRIPDLAEFTTAEINELIDMIKGQYDMIFESFL
jgi:hypothetical protein